MEQLEKAEVCDDPDRRRWYLSFVVVGGGFTGVEVAGEINDLIKNGRAVSATAEGVELHDGRVLHGATVVCTIGTTAQLLVHRLDAPKERSRLLTDPDMRVRGTSSLWAVGDCAHIVNAYDGQVSPTTGQFAERQGRQAVAATPIEPVLEPRVDCSRTPAAVHVYGSGSGPPAVS